MRSSLILLAATRILMPLLLLYSFFLFWRGHNEPGGGFVGGLVASVAFVLYALTSGVAAGRRALRIDPSALAASGLAVALVSGLPGVLMGHPFMTAVWRTVRLGSASLALGTPLLFDLGVFLAVVGVVLTIVFTLADAVQFET